jgi:hypothetical protein
MENNITSCFLLVTDHHYHLCKHKMEYLRSVDAGALASWPVKFGPIMKDSMEQKAKHILNEAGDSLNNPPAGGGGVVSVPHCNRLCSTHGGDM